MFEELTDRITRKVRATGSKSASYSIIVFRGLIYISIISSISIFLIFPWSIFLFNNLYTSLVSPYLNHDLVIPINFDSQFINQPSFVMIDLNQTHIFDLLSSTDNYDLQLNYQPYCSTNTGKNHLGYSIKTSLLNTSVAKDLIYRHEMISTHHYTKINHTKTEENQLKLNPWPITKHSIYHSDTGLSIIQSFYLSCLSPFEAIPEILIQFIPPIFYPKTSLILLPNFQLYSHTNDSLIIEFNSNELVIDHKTSYLSISKAKTWLQQDYGLYYQSLKLFKNKILHYVIGCSVMFIINWWLFIIITSLGWYYGNYILYEDYIKPMLIHQLKENQVDSKVKEEENS